MKILFALLFISASVLAGVNSPESRAVEFNRWYANQVNADHYPITEGREIDKYVTAATLKKLRHADDPRFADEEFYDADIFTKSQYIGDDWASNVTAIAGDTDPVCVNIYIAFGKKKDHIVIDCMVKEGGSWKVQSVASHEFTENLNVK
ncbi:TPA: DUF3828 domain-containing protein [Citrobacter amalonaticus]